MKLKFLTLSILMLAAHFLVSCGSSPSSPAAATATPVPATSTPTPTPNVTIIANFTSPMGMCLDTQGNLYVALSSAGTVAKITSAGVTSTAATGMAGVQDVKVDGSGDIFTAANTTYLLEAPVTGGGNVSIGYGMGNTYTCVGLNSAGTTLYAGSSAILGQIVMFTATSAATIATGATYGEINGITFDANGNMFFSDYALSSRVGEITAASLASGSPAPVVFAGIGTAGWTDGANLSAAFSNPVGISAASSGNIFVADTGNGAIREIASGAVTTFIAATHSPSTGFTTAMANPYGVVAGANGVVYFSDQTSGNIYKYQP